MVAMRAIELEFEKESDHQLGIAYGSSGRLYAQIINGAPFDAFFSADQAKPLLLEQKGHTVLNSRFSYAEGALVLWTNTIKLESSIKEKNLLSVLQQGHFNKLAIANPRLAPYGIAAVEVLENLKLVEQTKKLWVMGENIAQTYQFINSGNADLGFVALAQVIDLQNTKPSSIWKVPSELHQAIQQDAVLLKQGEKNAAAVALLEFIRSDKGKAIIEAHGYKI